MTNELERLRQEVAAAHQLLDEMGLPRVTKEKDRIVKAPLKLTLYARLECLRKQQPRVGFDNETTEVSHRSSPHLARTQ